MFMVFTLIKKGRSAFFSEQQSILSAATVIGAMYGVSALLGFVKNRMLAHYFGDSNELGIYFAADLIPSFIYTMIIMGAMSAAFIPVFKRKYKNDKDDSWLMASSVLNFLLLLFLAFAIFVLIFAPGIAQLFVANQSSLLPSEIQLMANLMRVMIFAQILLILSSVFTGILESFNRFIVSAFAPIAYNIGIIIVTALLFDRCGIYAPAIGMVVGSILHAASQIPFIKELGYNYIPIINWRDKGFREIIKLSIPRMIGNAAPQLLRLVFTNLALFISAPSMVVWRFASDLQIVPVRLFGISIGRAALPFLTDSVKEGDVEEFKGLLVRTITQTLFFMLPIAVLLFILKVPLVRLAFGAKTYSWGATIMTAYTLAFFSISIAIQAVINILVKAFFALKDTRTPVISSFVTVVSNSILAIYFVYVLHWGVWSLGLAYSVGSFVDFSLLYIFLQKKIGCIKVLGNELNKIIVSTLIMGVALYIPIHMLDEVVIDTTRTLGLIILTGIVSVIGLITYVLLAYAFKIEEFNLLVVSVGTILKRFRRKIF